MAVSLIVDADGGMEPFPTTYEFRWDVEAPLSERKFGQAFMRQWKRDLQAQKLKCLVTARVAPGQARFQLCTPDGAPPDAVSACEAQVEAELFHLCKRQTPASSVEAEAPVEPAAESASLVAVAVEGKPAERHPAGWQGVRVWLTYRRTDVEQALEGSRKPRRH